MSEVRVVSMRSAVDDGARRPCLFSWVSLERTLCFMFFETNDLYLASRALCRLLVALPLWLTVLIGDWGSCCFDAAESMSDWKQCQDNIPAAATIV